MAKCTYTKPDGSVCRANAAAGGAFCTFHDPENAAMQAAAKVEGGRARSRPRAVLPEGHPEMTVASARDVGRLLSDTINQVRTGKIDPRIANTVGYLASVLLRSVEVGELEERLASLEASVAASSNMTGMSEHREFEPVGQGAKSW